jgi:DNA-binding MarR family transcriptional regulator
VTKLPIFFEENSEPVDRRVAVGLHKLGLAMKQQAWSQANEHGLSPTQGQILATLALEGELNSSELSTRLGITLATISDSVRALVEKRAVEKRPDARHPRASLVALTVRGRALAEKASSWPDFLASAVGELSTGEQEAVLAAVIKMIRSLQLAGKIPTSRMCITCRSFRPNVHDGPMPHHCALVDAPMADRHLRIECAEHDEADAQLRDESWRRFSDL